jgi:phage shock protein PspC (stress-responsive transcriptional regulator)
MMGAARTDDALLAGVCSGIARALNWNVWALRALFVVFLVVKTLWAVVAYAVLALAFHFHDGPARRRRSSGGGLSSPELSERDQRISELEKRFKDLEDGN